MKEQIEKALTLMVAHITGAALIIDQINFILGLPIDIVLWSAVVFVILSGFLIFRGLYLSKRILILILIIFVWRFCQIIWTLDPSSTLREFVKTMILIGFIICSSNLMGNGRHKMVINVMKYYITAFLIITCIYILLILNSQGWYIFGQDSIKMLIKASGGSNIMAAIVMIILVFNWYLIKKGERLGFINLPLGLFSLIAISSEGALVGFAFSLIGLGIKKIKGKAGLVVVLITIMVSLYILCSIIFNPRFLISNFNLGSFHGRMELWQAAVDTIGNDFIFGTGAASWGVYGGTMVLPYGLSVTFSGDIISGGVHNNLLQIWMEDGLPGLLLYIGIFIYIMINSYKYKGPTSFITISYIFGVYARNMAESNGLLFGLINNFSIFISWFLLILLNTAAKWEECGK